MNETISIPAIGYELGSSDYGEALHEAVGEMRLGYTYTARLVKAEPPSDWSEEEKEDFPPNAYNLVLTPMNMVW